MLSSIFTVGFLVSLLAGTIRLATPILLPALGQIYTQRAGILNLGVEGTMTIGAVAGFSAAYKTAISGLDFCQVCFRYAVESDHGMAFSHHACQSGHRRYCPEYSWCGYSGLCISYHFWCTESAASGNTVCSREYSGIIIHSGDRTDFSSNIIFWFISAM